MGECLHCCEAYMGELMSTDVYIEKGVLVSSMIHKWYCIYKADIIYIYYLWGKTQPLCCIDTTNIGMKYILSYFMLSAVLLSLSSPAYRPELYYTL